MGGDSGVGDVDVWVGLDEVGSQDGGEELRGRDGMLFGEDVDGVFDGVCGDNHAVVGFCIAVWC